MKKLREALLLSYDIGGQGRETRHIVYPLQNGRWFYVVFLRRTNLSAKLQMTMASHMKRYAVSFVLLLRSKEAKRFFMGTL